MFYNTPIINIDHTSDNEHFGQINCVDMTATSVSEILYGLYNEIDTTIIDDTVSTYLLTGIISKTHSFKDPLLTPKTLTIASQLMTSGAKREEIVQQLYHTKTLSILKLWGRALARLEWDSDNSLVWTKLLKSDFSHCNTNEESLPDIIHELIAYSPQAKTIILFYEQQDGKTGCIIDGQKVTDVKEITKDLNPHGTQFNVKCALDTTIGAAIEEVLDKFKKKEITPPSLEGNIL